MVLTYKNTNLETQSIQINNPIDFKINGINIDIVDKGLSLRCDSEILVYPKYSNMIVVKQEKYLIVKTNNVMIITFKTNTPSKKNKLDVQNIHLDNPIGLKINDININIDVNENGLQLCGERPLTIEPKYSNVIEVK